MGDFFAIGFAIAIVVRRADFGGGLRHQGPFLIGDQHHGSWQAPFAVVEECARKTW